MSFKSTTAKLFKNVTFLFILGLLIGALIILAIRYFTYNPHLTHYHANFAVYLNGQREEFKNPAYYEEITACQANGPIKPEQRVHMHDGINSVVHVHDDGVTWGDLFQNLGWYVGPDFIETRDGTMYQASGNNKLHVILNGTDYTDGFAIARQVIGDEDRLLISFGDITPSTLQQEFKSVPATAHHYDVSSDPATCSSGEKATPSVRLKHLF